VELSSPTPEVRVASETATGRVLVVDDTAANLRLISTLLQKDGYTVVTASNGADAIGLLRPTPPDLVLLDVRMPGLDGFTTCRTIKNDPATRLIPVVLVTALQDTDDRIRGIEAGADDFLTKPFNVHELRARIRSLVRLKRYTDELDSAQAAIVALALAIEARDATTDGHCQRLARYAASLGRALGLDHDDVAALHRGGFLHDIGKVGIPDAVLLKTSRLTAEEYAVMKQHTIIGDRVCSELRSLQRVRPIVRHHHERLDGTGYPDGLRGDEIPLLAQITSVVDVYDAITTERPYKRALPPHLAFEELRREAALGWRRRDLVDTFIDVLSGVVQT
jgi:cyclic di-GMP phosphodiesterase